MATEALAKYDDYASADVIALRARAGMSCESLERSCGCHHLVCATCSDPTAVEWFHVLLQQLQLMS